MAVMPEANRQLGAAKAEKALRSLLDFELSGEQFGFKVYPNGIRKPMRRFLYSATTTQHAA